MKASKTRGFLTILWRLGCHIFKYKTSALMLTVAVLGYSGIARIMPWIVGYAIDHGFSKNDLAVIQFCAGAYFLAHLMASILFYLQNIWFQKLGNRVLFDIREKLISHILSLPISYFDKNRSGRIITRVTNDIASLGNFFSQVLFSLVNATIESVAIVISLILISPNLTAVSLILAPVIAFVALKISQKIRQVFNQQKQKISLINSFLAEHIAGMSILRLYHRIPKSQKHFQRLSNEYKLESLKMAFNYALLWPLLSLFNASCILLTLFYGGYLTFQQTLAIGSLVTFILHIQDLHEPLSSFLEKYVMLQDSLASADRIFDLLDVPAENLSGQVLKKRIQGHIVIKDISFRYHPTSPWVLKNFSLEIQAGEIIGVVGKTGSGKSTLISLLQKFYSPTEGEIFVDGHPLSQIQALWWRQQICVIHQEPFIFRGTIASNIALNTNVIGPEKIHSAASLADGLSSFRNRQNGIYSSVEEKGANLSTGEKQLIALARVFAFDPPILVLDEATANIDSKTESLIQEALRKATQSRTCIIVAHRLSTLQICHRIVVIDNHQVAEVGTHNELMERKGIYFDLYTHHYLKSKSPNLWEWPRSLKL